MGRCEQDSAPKKALKLSNFFAMLPSTIRYELEVLGADLSVCKIIDMER